MIHTSPQAAVSWAYRVLAADVIKISSLGRWRGEERTRASDERMSPQEQHGYAIQVLGHIERLPPQDHAMVHCEMWPSRIDSKRSDPSYRAGIEILARQVILVQGSGVMVSQRAAIMCVEQFFSDGRRGNGIGPIRREEHCRKAEALHRREDGFRRLTLVHNRAWETLGESLTFAGFVRPAVMTADGGEL